MEMEIYWASVQSGRAPPTLPLPFNPPREARNASKIPCSRTKTHAKSTGALPELEGATRIDISSVFPNPDLISINVRGMGLGSEDNSRTSRLVSILNKDFRNYDITLVVSPQYINILSDFHQNMKRETLDVLM